MGLGIFIIFLSAFWALILIVRVDSILGQKYLMVSGDNIFNAEGIVLSDGTYLLLWLIAIGGFCLGIWLIIKNLLKKSAVVSDDATATIFNIDNEEKKCPSCAEKIKLEALKCKYCGEVFNKDDVNKQIGERKSKLNTLNKIDSFLTISARVAKELSGTLKSEEELTILNSLSRLSYEELSEMSKTPDEFTKTGLYVYKLFYEKIKSVIEPILPSDNN